MSAGNIDEARQLLEARAHELRDELKRIEEAIRSLGASAGRRREPAVAQVRPRGRRAEQALELIAEHPGITIRELASQMGLKGPHYLYRVLPRLEGENLIAKKGSGYRIAKS
jgi:hypothetical protein